MAELLGTVASAAQLLGLVASLSKELYNFVTALKDSSSDMISLVSGLEALDSVLENIRPEHVGRAGLSESLVGIKCQLDALRKLLPIEPQRVRTFRKLKWVFDERKLKRIGTKIAEYKSTLQMAMMVISLDEGIKHQQKSQEIHQLAQLSHSLALTNFAELGGKMSAVHDGLLPLMQHMQLAEPDRRLINNTNTLMLDYPSTLSQHPDMVIKKFAARVVEDIQDVATPPSYHPLPTQENQVTFEQTIHAVDMFSSTNAQLDSRVLFLEANSVQRSEIQDLQLALQKMQRDMPKQPANQLKVIEMFIAPGETNVSKIVRSTLQAVLIRVLDGCVGQYTSWYDRALKDIKSMIDEISNMVSKGEQDGWDRPHEIFKRNEHRPIRNDRIVTQEWYSKRAIGSLTVRISNSRPLRKSKRRGGRLFEVTCGFHPDPKVFRGVGVEAMISPQSNRGFSQICPVVAEFGVQPEDSPIFEYSGTGGMENVYRLQDLFQKGLASPNDRDQYGWTALMHAASKAHFEVCKFLLDANADPCIENQYGTNALDALLRWSFTRLSSERQRENFFAEKSSTALLQDFVKTCLLLEEAGADPEESFETDGKFILSQLTSETMYLGKGFREDIALSDWSTFLSRRGFDINAKDETGKTALMEKASRSQYADSGNGLATLLRAGANVSTTDRDGRQALHYAVGLFRYEPIEYGFESEADAREDRVRKISELIKYGADIYAVDDEGCSVSKLADENNVSAIWDDGLARSGLIPDEVRGEDRSRSHVSGEARNLVSITDALHIDIKTLPVANECLQIEASV